VCTQGGDDTAGLKWAWNG